MPEMNCKIQQLLADNTLGLHADFIDYLSQPENVQQLSILVSALRQQDNPACLHIAEPTTCQGLINTDTESLAVEQEDASIEVVAEMLEQDAEPQQQHLQPIASAQDRTTEQSTPSITENNSMWQPELKFQVDNARVGQVYQSEINLLGEHSPQDLTYKTDSFKFSDAHFYFDAETQSIHGQPEHAGEVNVNFQYVIGHETRSAQLKMNVIADPRSLWKILEPADGQPYAKAHSACDRCVLNDYSLVAASRRGRSHEHAGSFRDDDFAILPIKDSAWSVLAVADGAGSADFSREGSRIAVEVVKQHFQDYFDAENLATLTAQVEQWQVGQQDEATQALAAGLNEQFHHVYYQIYTSILEQIEQQALEQEVPSKAFSTTLLIAVVYSQANKNFISTFSVGDGAIAVYDAQNIRLMNVADGGEYAGQTKFLDRSIAHEFASRVKIGCYGAIDAIYLMTDGISDPMFETEVGLTQHEKWQNLHHQLAPLMLTDNADEALLQWMHFFSTGHHDDRTMALLWKHHESQASTL